MRTAGVAEGAGRAARARLLRGRGALLGEGVVSGTQALKVAMTVLVRSRVGLHQSSPCLP
jgi:hypothetical protein